MTEMMPPARAPDAGWVHGRDYKVVPVDQQQALLFVTGNHRVFEVSAELGQRLMDGLGLLTADEAEEWAVLQTAGLLDNVHTPLLARSRYSDGANLAINLNLTGSCNLACTYCFADGGDYGRIRNKMESGTVDYVFDFIREHVTESQVVRFEFFGGEPLINFARIQEVCERSDQFTAETGVRFINRISTNLTVLPDAAIDLFRDRTFIVSVSIDGGAETHNRNRPTKSGQGSFDQILANCRRVRAAGDAITMVARMTVVSSEPSLLENVRELWGHNLFDYFQITPGVTSPGTGGCGSAAKQEGTSSPIMLLLDRGDTMKPVVPESRATMNPTFVPQLAELLAYYPQLFQPDNRFKGVLEYERIAEMVLDGKMALAFCSAGGTYYTFSPDDSIMACHRMVGQVEFQVGSGPEGLTGDVSEWTLPVDTHPICSQCWARYVCGGNCRQENYVATGTLRGLNEESCAYQLHLTESIVRLVGSGTPAYRAARRRLDDLFVSCGRPVTRNWRGGDEQSPSVRRLQHFHLLSAAS